MPVAPSQEFQVPSSFSLGAVVFIKLNMEYNENKETKKYVKEFLDEWLKNKWTNKQNRYNMHMNKIWSQN